MAANFAGGTIGKGVGFYMLFVDQSIDNLWTGVSEQAGRFGEGDKLFFFLINFHQYICCKFK
jgi:hypothetical protein